ncbi:MAG: 6-phosphogluconolactonase [Gemmatimonadota bacterium]
MTNSVPEHEVVVAPIEALRVGFVELVRDLGRDAIARRQRFALAVPGGSVASRLLTALTPHTVAWGQTDLYWCDERVVPEDHPDSNSGTARTGWLQPLAGSGVRIHPMVTAVEPPGRIADRYAEQLAATLGTPPVLDLLVVGVGEDGHVGSLFPGLPGLAEAARWVIGVEQAPKLPRQRVSMTLPVVTGARCLVVAAFGASKRDVMRCAIEEPTCVLPVALALRGAARAVVLLDDAAASTLSVFRRASGT